MIGPAIRPETRVGEAPHDGAGPDRARRAPGRGRRTDFTGHAGAEALNGKEQERLWNVTMYV